MAQMKTGFEKCADPNTAQHAQYVSYATISRIASGCGFPAGTVKASPPALDTCEGAVAKFSGLNGAVCPQEEGENDEENHTPASCGNSTACKDLISSLDDCAMAQMKTGLEKCANDPNMAWAAQYAPSVSYAMISRIAGGCGFPASTVKASAPALDTCEGAVATISGLYGPVCPQEEGENDDLAMRRAWPKA